MIKKILVSFLITKLSDYNWRYNDLLSFRRIEASKKEVVAAKASDDMRKYSFYIGKKIHMCTWEGCGKCFTQKSHLKPHLSTHTGYKPHNCTWEGCGKSFFSNTSLNVHLRSHTGEKPFKCTWDGCDKRFSESGNMKKHMYTHTGEKPYMCPRCDHRCTRSNDLKKHFERKHKITGYEKRSIQGAR